MVIAYNNASAASSAAKPAGAAADYTENVEIKYMVNDDKFYIFEHVKSGTNKEYDRVWLVQQVQNRPYFMRITYLAQMTAEYQNARGGAELLIKSLAALRNEIQQQDRGSMLDIVIEAQIQGQDQAEGRESIRKAMIQPSNLIHGAIDLIEEDLGSTVVGGDSSLANESSEEDDAARRVGETRAPKVFKEDYRVPDMFWDIEAVQDWGERIASYTEE